MAVFWTCPLYCMGSALSSSATHEAPLNLAALMCIHKARLQAWLSHHHLLSLAKRSLPGQQSPWEWLFLLLGLEEEGTHTLPDRAAQLWEQEELWRACCASAPHCSGDRLPALWLEGPAVLTGEVAGIWWIHSTGIVPAQQAKRLTLWSEEEGS